MKIELLSKYKSLNPFISDELNNFTAIIGANGSGKTQLLDVVSQMDKTTSLIISDSIINNIKVNGIDSYQIKVISESNLTEIKKSFYSDYKKIPNEMFSFFEYLKTANLLEDISKIILPSLEKCIDSGGHNFDFFENEKNFSLLLDSEEYSNLVEKTYDSVKKHVEYLGIEYNNLNNWYTLSSRIKSIYSKEFFLLLSVLGSDFKLKQKVKHYIELQNPISSVMEFILEASKINNKEIDKLEEIDFLSVSISPNNIKNNLFNQNIEYVFFSYASRREDNRYDFFKKNSDGELNDSISDEEFIKSNPKPWDILNSILDKYKIDFYFQALEGKKFNKNISHKPRLYKKHTNEEVDYEHLSSGEKIIIGLILLLFNTEFYNKNLQFPDLILLDEPDAHLHPEMTKMLIDILQDIFVNKFHIKVIITTHNPSTIALLHDDSIYQIKNGVETSLKKINKDDALKLLTSFIPTLNIDYKNHRQVFVESPTDVMYYQKIYNKLSQLFKFKYKLYFVSADYGDGNCTQVTRAVNDLGTAGIKSIFGVIDWDCTNHDQEKIKVHGENNRYSIENYLYDPLYISILFIDENAYGFMDELDYSLNPPYSLPQDKSKAQQAINLFFDKLCKDDKNLELKYKEKIDVCYGNDLKLLLPKNYLIEQGHDFLTSIRNKFDFFNKYNDKKLNKKMTGIIVRCYPYIPKDTLELIKELAVISTDK